MNYRHEYKHEINASDMMAVRHRLRAVAKTDAHATDGRYFIRSLYFDNFADKALREKIDGVNHREKFRIRYYNHDASLLHLEKKSRQNGLSEKSVTFLTSEEVQLIIQNRTNFMHLSDRPLLQELYCKMRSQGLFAKTIVDYTREAFIYAPGNVRITLDYDIRTALRCTDFLSPDCVTVPIPDTCILEVKWDSFLPAVIRDTVQLDGRRSSSFSKYAACRIYG
ncbi:MAG: polyphosphate polymerase domain-containing protein [Lachnospiraceae bacterium]|nr:polyphosphate polymerase domain-containing protein [Lachnospiraceae bacterium]